MSLDFTPAAVAREEHRDLRGRFGTQPATESDTLLAPSRDQLHEAAVRALRHFDPGLTGTRGGTVTEAVRTHSLITAGTSRTATENDRARAVAAVLRAETDQVGGLSSSDTDHILAAALPGPPWAAQHLAATHRHAGAHVAAVRAGRARIGDHPEDAWTLRSYRSQVGIDPADPGDPQGQAEELSLAWSYRLDRDALDAVRASRPY